MPTDKTRRFGSYVLKRELGHGVMGTVYLAEDESSHERLAVKVLSATVAANREYIRRFLTEARVATQLNHPNIVSVRDYGKDNGHYYLTMAYVDGQSCKARIHQQKRVDWREAVEIAIQTAQGLSAATEQGIIHRDIKPENILLDTRGRVRITDLGLAKEVGVIHPLPSDTSLGTPDYMSPEQVSNSETVDFRSDIYSLGATLFHMICGKAPYTGRSAYEVMVKHVSAALPSPLKYVPDLPQRVCDVMRKMMARDPDDRYQGYEELIADLNALLVGASVSAAQFQDESMLATDDDSLSRASASRNRKLVWVVAVPILAGIGVLVYLLVAR